ncbi:MAG: hypothetical protein HOW73_04675 [Polyangiaceae bacterium]|nr:hypothetical protein [Polyangiaceae bacterium]
MNHSRSSSWSVPTLIAAAALLVFAGGCATTKTQGEVGKSSGTERPVSLEGVHSERIALRTDNPQQVAGVLHGVLNIGRNEATDDVRAVFLERSTSELVVIGTDKGIARVRALLTPALIGDPSQAANGETATPAAPAVAPPADATGPVSQAVEAPTAERNQPNP